MTAAFSPSLLQFSRSRHPEPPPHLGPRYDLAGNFRYEPGNTVVCHLVKGSETERACIAARETYLAMPEASQFTFTPISSLHMTLFQGIIEHRRKPLYWPADIAPDTPIDEMTAIMGERLAGFPVSTPFKVAVTEARPSGLLMEGATEADRRALREWRNAFAEVLGYRHPDHEEYRFHITFSYVVERLSDEALPRWQAMLDKVAADMRAAAPLLELKPPAFCSFDDMKHFEELMIFEFRQ